MSVNILKVIGLHTFKQVNCRVCELYLKKAMILRGKKKNDIVGMRI